MHPLHYDNDLNELVSFELAELEYCVFRDRSFYHTVSEVLPLEDDEPAYRDALTLEIRLL